MRVLPWILSPSKTEWRLVVERNRKIASVLKRQSDGLWVPRVFLAPEELGPGFPEVTHAAEWAEVRVRAHEQFPSLFS